MTKIKQYLKFKMLFGMILAIVTVIGTVGSSYYSECNKQNTDETIVESLMLFVANPIGNMTNFYFHEYSQIVGFRGDIDYCFAYYLSRLFMELPTEKFTCAGCGLYQEWSKYYDFN
ncbi:MAG: hypothetical protein FWF76_01020 [Oscillospiraceae bacterium]|nr:hypothetical protein [Oscillospiraceae bacterium]